MKNFIIILKITPNSNKNEFVSFENDILKIKIKAPAEKGKANKELIKFISKELGKNKLSKCPIYN